MRKKPTYRPASKLTPEQRAGDCTDGDTWQPWKKDSYGEQWYCNLASESAPKQKPKRATAETGMILGIPADNDDLVLFY